MKEGFDYMPVPHEASDSALSVEKNEGINESENAILSVAEILANSLLEMCENDKLETLSKKSVEDFIRSNLSVKPRSTRDDEVPDPFGPSQSDDADFQFVLTRVTQELERNGILVIG